MVTLIETNVLIGGRGWLVSVAIVNLSHIGDVQGIRKRGGQVGPYE